MGLRGPLSSSASLARVASPARVCALCTLGKYLRTGQQAAGTAAAAPSRESSVFLLLLETAFPGLRKRTEALSMYCVY